MGPGACPWRQLPAERWVLRRGQQWVLRRGQQWVLRRSPDRGGASTKEETCLLPLYLLLFLSRYVTEYGFYLFELSGNCRGFSVSSSVLNCNTCVHLFPEVPLARCSSSVCAGKGWAGRRVSHHRWPQQVVSESLQLLPFSRLGYFCAGWVVTLWMVCCSTMEQSYLPQPLWP